MIKIYRKTVTIKVEKFDGSNEMADKYGIEFDEAYILSFRLDTLEGWIGIRIGDWIATGVKGEHWAIANDIFKKTYAELPVIPQYVAEYIADMKLQGDDIWDATHHFIRDDNLAEYMEDNSETFTRAWLDGYQLEEEK
jgi:hypothetical protein